MTSNNHRTAFTLLPPAKPRWSAIGASAGIQCVALVLLIWVPLLLPQKLMPMTHFSVIPLLTTRPVTPFKPQPPPKFKPKPPPPTPAPVPEQVVARLMAPTLVAPKPKPRVLPKEDAPSIPTQFQSMKLNAPPSPMPAPPRPEIKTGVLSGSSAPATLNRPAQQVQTGGFGDPNGVPATGNGKRAATIAQKGSYDLPPGPGNGNGTGGAKGVPGTVASAGFGNGVARPGSGRGGSGVIRQGGFADQSRPAETSHAQAAKETPGVQPVEILYKPDPAYTAEARALRLEGEVLLEVVFTATGEVRVGRVMRGMGHGLDETAVAAAKQIRFKPERVNGQPVDFTATVHIVFQLAY
jgi:TonB family protein